MSQSQFGWFVLLHLAFDERPLAVVKEKKRGESEVELEGQQNQLSKDRCQDLFNSWAVVYWLIRMVLKLFARQSPW